MDKKVLYIDDDEVTRETITLRLSKKGFTIVTSSGDLDKICSELTSVKHDVVLLSESLIESDVFESIELIRKHFDEVTLPIILLVSSANYTTVCVRALNLGVSDFLTKPINIEIAAARIDAHIKFVKLNEDSKAKSELNNLNAIIATYNHEINNPLAIAHGNVQLLETMCKDDSIKDIITKIHKALERVAAIIKDIEHLNTTKGRLATVDYAKLSKMLNVSKQ